MQEEVKKALEVLRGGGVILYPTDTIWGIGCDATNQEAVDKVYSLKKRDPQKSMLVLVRDFYMAERYLDELPEIGIQLFEATDSPLTLIFDGAKNVAKNLPAQDGSLGMRIPEDSFCQELLNQFRKPIVSSSANFSGKKSPDSFLEIEDEVKDAVDYVVNWRQDGAHSKPSSVILLRKNGEIKILRK